MNARPYLREISLKRDRIASLEEYPFNIPAVRELDTLEFHPDVTFLVGENGAGKSTVLEAIALASGFAAEGGTRNYRFSTADTSSALHQVLKLVKSFSRPKDYFFLRAESFYNVATYADEIHATQGFGSKSLHHRSHGESFMSVILDKLRGNGFYLFDEPEAALSPVRQMAALTAIHRLVQQNSQFIIATHSPILLAYPNAKIVLFDRSGLSEVKYEDTEHYAVTRHFLNHYPKMLAELLSDD